MAAYAKKERNLPYENLIGSHSLYPLPTLGAEFPKYFTISMCAPATSKRLQNLHAVRPSVQEL